MLRGIAGFQRLAQRAVVKPFSGFPVSDSFGTNAAIHQHQPAHAVDRVHFSATSARFSASRIRHRGQRQHLVRYQHAQISVFQSSSAGAAGRARS